MPTFAKKKDMIELHETSEKIIRSVSQKFKRFLFDQIDWQARLIEISGARGVGKTTLMLQKAQLLNQEATNQALYATLDDPYFYNHNLIETADQFLKNGGKVLFLDEVHKYPPKFEGHDWSAEIKNLYDKFPELKVVYSGSSLLRLFKGKGDLSRRRISCNLPGMSLREYLLFSEKLDVPAIQLDDLIRNHLDIAREIVPKIKIIPQFNDYIDHGYYPFYKEAPDYYFDRLKDVISVILEHDVPAVTDAPFITTVKLKKLLAVIADSVPVTPNLSVIRSELFIADHRTLLKYLNLLDFAELITLLGKEAKGNQILRKPEKIFLNNPNLMHCFSVMPNRGNLRETFFINQTGYLHDVKYPDQGDFLIDDKYVFEVGGKNKVAGNLKNVPDSYLALDNIETGFGKTIPIWLFGFLY
jgi:uncharacterized protein